MLVQNHNDLTIANKIYSQNSTMFGYAEMMNTDNIGENLLKLSGRYEINQDGTRKSFCLG